MIDLIINVRFCWRWGSVDLQVLFYFFLRYMVEFLQLIREILSPMRVSHIGEKNELQSYKGRSI